MNAVINVFYAQANPFHHTPIGTTASQRGSFDQAIPALGIIR